MGLYDRTAYKFKGGLERYTTSFLISPEWVGHICILHTLKTIIQRKTKYVCVFYMLLATIQWRIKIINVLINFHVSNL